MQPYLRSSATTLGALQFVFSTNLVTRSSQMVSLITDVTDPCPLIGCDERVPRLVLRAGFGLVERSACDLDLRLLIG